MLEIPLWYVAILFFILGACVGSFYNVLIYRMPRGMSLFRPGSHCPHCGAPIPIYYNLPLAGWLWLRGKSACCKKPVSIRYPLVELLCALLAVLAVFAANFAEPWTSYAIHWADTLALFWLLLAIVPVTVVDLEFHLIPDSMSLGGVAVGLLLSFFPGGLSVWESLWGAVFAGGGLYLLGLLASKLLKKEAMGLGDVKLLAGYGALMGIQAAFITLVVASLLGIFVIIPARKIL
ncbi:MAG: prepilin peptidase, partial [Fibrobacter sp.]|nr:prepilin peptidase [Fibrobacter sp.]